MWATKSTLLSFLALVWCLNEWWEGKWARNFGWSFKERRKEGRKEKGAKAESKGRPGMAFVFDLLSVEVGNRRRSSYNVVDDDDSDDINDYDDDSDSWDSQSTATTTTSTTWRLSHAGRLKASGRNEAVFWKDLFWNLNRRRSLKFDSVFSKKISMKRNRSDFLSSVEPFSKNLVRQRFRLEVP